MGLKNWKWDKRNDDVRGISLGIYEQRFLANR